MAVNRRLEYKDLFVWSLEQDISDRYDNLDISQQFQFSDQTTRHVFVIALNQEEYTKLSSSVFTGAYLTYPYENHEVEWLIPQLLGNNMPEICQAIADCITNSVVTQNAIDDFLQSSGYGSGDGTPATPSNYNDNPLLADGSLLQSCDNDNLFGAITQLVDLLNDILEDAFEAFEVQTARYERIGAILEAIPITNVLGIDDVVQFADQLLENIAQAYTGQYTAQLRDEYRCDLFCLVKDTCELDFQTFADYFTSRASTSITETAYENAINWFTGGNFTGDEIVHAAHAILVQSLAWGSKFFNLDNVWLSKAVTSFMNDPDSDWSMLCTDCSDTILITFDAGSDTYTIIAGSEQSGFGNPDDCVRDTASGQYALAECIVEHNFGTPVQIDRVNFDQWSDRPAVALRVRAYDASHVQLYQQTSTPNKANGSWVNFNFNLSGWTGVQYLEVRVANSNGTQTDSIDERLDNILIEYS